MSKSAAWLDYQVQAGTPVLRAGGEWNVRQLADLADQLEKFEFGKYTYPVIDLSEITELDTSGAWRRSKLEQGYQRGAKNRGRP